MGLGGAKGAVPSMTRMLLQQALPSAGMTAAYNMLSGAGLGPSLAAGAIDLGINVGGMRLAGKYAPGNLGTTTYKDNKTGKLISKQEYIPSGPQAIVQNIAPILSSVAVLPLTQGQQQTQQQQAANIDQTSALYQQALQRDYINKLQVEALSPGTNFQMQGLEQTYNPALSNQLTIPAGLDPYGLSRGSF